MCERIGVPAAKREDEAREEVGSVYDDFIWFRFCLLYRGSIQCFTHEIEMTHFSANQISGF